MPDVAREYARTVTAMDEYLHGLAEPQRATLAKVRAQVHASFPGVEEVVSYGLPAFRIDGLVVGAFAARKDGCSWYPMSGSLLDGFDLASRGYTRTKGALHFPADAPLDQEFLAELIRARLAMR